MLFQQGTVKEQIIGLVSKRALADKVDKVV